MSNIFSEKIQNLPTKPGVYLFKDERDQVLYVGKAKNLKIRVGSYFKSDHLDRPWIAVMMGLIADVEITVVNNELEALILESSLISEFQPKFNIKLTDDKSYPFIKLTINETFPRLQVVRRHNKDGSRYFGPYLSAWSARLTCEFLRRLYGVHISNRPLKVRDPSTSLGAGRPCLNCQLEDNHCPLANQIDTETYALLVVKASEFLQGKRQSIVKDLDLRMELASQNQNYELAAKLRDQLRAVHHVTSPQDIVSGTDEDCDVIATATANQNAVVTLAPVRNGQFGNPRHFVFDLSASHSDSEVIRQFILSMYHNSGSIPSLVVTETPIDDNEFISNWLSNIFGKRIELRVAKRGEKLDFVALAKKNAQAKLESLLFQDNDDFSGLIALKDLLKLPKIPLRIEAVDISNLGASEPVGATVCFVDGQPDKNEYRRYRINSVKGQNDFAMIGEVTARRFADTSRPLPDLFIVDGGPQQLKFVLTGLKKAGQKPKTIIALAKNPDRIFLAGEKRPVAATRGNKGALLLARIRDEVHRFGITFQRSRQRKKSLGTIDKSQDY